MRRYSRLLFILALVGCNEKVIPLTEQFVIRSELESSRDITIHNQQSSDDRIIPSSWMTYIDDLDGFIISYPADYPESQPIFMNAMDMKRTKSCSFFGVTKPLSLKVEGDEGTWGKVDAWKGMNEGGGFEMTEKLLNSPCRNFEDKPMYGFCAEKDGKAVAICIQQMTDDEAMAKEIFESFRWTE